ncbi:MAG: M23 family metallopeptidase [Bacillota bacterium]|nr:M23 family metallopeptidase [Bacillota bacterium]MDW7684356.1 M23 family metallopeptidase [Bacillota bacterium]
MKMKRLLPVLTIILLLALPAAALAAPEQPVADTPTGIPGGMAYRPDYLRQLSGLQDREEKQEKQAAGQFEHRVARGETLGAIAKRYGTSVEYLLRVNNMVNPHFIREGQVLTLLTEEAAHGADVAQVVHTLRRGETVWDLARRYNVSMNDILSANNVQDVHRLQAGQELLIPGASGPVTIPATSKRNIVLASRSSTRSGQFIWPTHGYISSGYGPRWGRFHYAIDIAADTGTPIFAIAGGVVSDAGWRQGYGYMVRIDHKNGWESVYGHASRLFVMSGQAVNSGQQIAAIGQTGNATGPHVHLEMIYQGKFQNPLKYLPSR